MNSEQIIASLKELVATGDAPGKVLTDPADLDTYGKDWTKIHPPKPLAIALPKTTEQVQALVPDPARQRNRPYRQLSPLSPPSAALQQLRLGRLAQLPRVLPRPTRGPCPV